MRVLMTKARCELAANHSNPSHREEHGEKMISAQYLGMPVEINDLDHENLDYFAYCAKHDFRLQRCASCKLFRYLPSTACPWCAELNSEWVSVEGRGTVHSYTEVHHAIQPAFKQYTPYLVLLVELDTQSGKPTKEAGTPRDWQPDAAGWRARAEERGRAGRHRYPRAHGIHRCRAGAGAAAMDH